MWFLDCWKDCIGDDNDGTPYTIMSDRQKGLVKAVQHVFPSCNVRFCIKHLYGNLKKDNPRLKLHKPFWACTRATNTYEFESAIRWMKKTSEAAHDWLADKPPYQWSRHAYNLTSKSEHRTNNMTESFNFELGDLRSFNQLKMVDQLRQQLMKRFHHRYAKATSMVGGKVTNNCKNRLMKLQIESRRCKLIPGRGDLYEVIEGPNKFSVDLNSRTCSCHWWAIAGLPCKHSIKAISFKNADVEDFCDKYFCVENYVKAYEGLIHPIATSDMERISRTVEMCPPPFKRQVGRPRKARKRAEDEGPSQKRSSHVTCSKCGTVGHNARGCQRGAVSQKGKKGKAKKKAAKKKVGKARTSQQNKKAKKNVVGAT